MNKTIILGDVHLGKGLSIGKYFVSNTLNSRVIDQLSILNWVLEQSINHDVKRIILTGDIFEDVKPDPSLMTIFINWLKNCEVNNIEVHIILGNHDLKRTGSLVSSSLDVVSAIDMDSVFVYNNMDTIHTPGVSFTLMPFRDKRSLDVKTPKEAIEVLESKLSYEAASIPIENEAVLIGHLALEGSIPVGDEFDDLLNELLCPLSMFNEYDYVWMGHIHKPQVCSKKPYIAHIGSMDLSDFGEADHHKKIIIFDPDSIQKFEELIIPSRPLKRIKLSIPHETDPTLFVSEQIEKMDSLAKSIVKIELKLENPEALSVDKDKIQDLLYKLGVFHISSFSESKNISVVSSDKKDLVDNTIKPKAAIKLWADIKFDDEEEKSAYINAAIEIIDSIKA